jgi:hypothetical protein
MFAGERFTQILYFDDAATGSGKGYGDALDIATNSAVYSIPAKTLITDCYVMVDTAVVGATDFDLGDATDPDGYFDGSASLTLGTPGVYGYDANASGAYLKAASGAGVAMVLRLKARADSSDDLDTKYFIIPDSAGSVAVWFDTDDSGSAEPAHGADRSIEITTVATDDTAATVASAVAALINADSEYSASAQGDEIVITLATVGSFSGLDAGDAGFEMGVDNPGQAASLNEGRQAKWVSTATDLAIAVTGTATAGAFRVILEGLHLGR